MEFKLRCRSEHGLLDIEIQELEPTWSTLIDKLANEYQCSPTIIQIKAGYPPQVLNPLDSLPLSQTGLRNKDQIMVSFNKEQPSQSLPTEYTPTKTTTAPPPTPAAIPATTATSSLRSKQVQPSQVTVESVPIATGVVIRRVMEDDNNCLFRAIEHYIKTIMIWDSYAMEQKAGNHNEYRQIVAQVITSNPEQYSDVFLGHSRSDYIYSITMKNAWGGAIELAIFSQFLQIGEGKYSQRIIVLYSGIHYDVVALSPTPDTIHLRQVDQTIFNIDDDLILTGALELAGIFQKKRAFTNVAEFTLRCENCQVGLKGHKEAELHAKESGHTNFQEY